ncbi:MAG: hypothetical protein MZV64_33455 [Ignavibacteriales bacterium]|nr:hypothetical protein [Ignavibacteriales bacterium]
MTHATPKKLGAPKAVAPKPALRRFHQASWDEPVIFELSSAGSARRAAARTRSRHRGSRWRCVR